MPFCGAPSAVSGDCGSLEALVGGVLLAVFLQPAAAGKKTA